MNESTDESIRPGLDHALDYRIRHMLMTPEEFTAKRIPRVGIEKVRRILKGDYSCLTKRDKISLVRDAKIPQVYIDEMKVTHYNLDNAPDQEEEHEHEMEYEKVPEFDYDEINEGSNGMGCINPLWENRHG